MTSQTTSSTRSPTPTPPRTQPCSASQPATQPLPTRHSLGESDPISRSRPACTQSAPTLPVPTSPPSARQGSNPQRPDGNQSGRRSSGASEQNTTTRGYTVHLPHNPSRPPPYTYQRQHEFPPFPPLTQHPVLPFLTTAFSNQPDGPTASLPKPRMTIAPRASTTQRHVHSNFSAIATMDVSKNDPTATFLRPPLLVPLPRNADPSIRPEVLNGNTSDSEPAPGSPLTYAILHNHRNWFLDADDFRKDNPNRIDYPPELEPPRGWAPLPECTGPGAASRCKQAKETKEKNSRTKGSYAHADKTITDTTIEYGPSDDWHEKTVLRCTFCRREYHGPNAKSMWRRHVYDKHKVAMKNRREGSAGMAPKVPLAKKGKVNAATPSPTRAQLDPSVHTSAPTLDPINEQNLIRLLERVVSGNLDINLPASRLNGCSSSEGGTINLEVIALALQKSGISLTLEKGSEVNSISEQPVDTIDKGNFSDVEKQSLLNRGQKEGENIDDTNDVCGVREDSQPSPSHPSTLIAEQVAAFLVDVSPQSSAVLTDSSAAHRSTTPSPLPSGAKCYGQKRKADSENPEQLRDRAPLKDNTTLERSNHNSKAQVVSGTPRKDKGKQKTTPRTTSYPNISQPMSPISSSPRNPYTPRYSSATALRARALATTGQESYLTLVLSSPGTASPVRCTGHVSFTSPYSRQTSPTKVDNDDRAPRSDDPLGILGTPSPRYPFDFNIEGTQSSPSYMTAFDPIPLELGSHTPAQWTPAPLGPPAPLSEPTSRSISRASSVTRNLDTDEDRDVSTDDDDQEMQLEYPEWSSPSERSKRGPNRSSRLLDPDFDMDAFLDLDDAAPAMGTNLASPHKTMGRGFSKEFGLLSPQEVERITATARLTLEEEARSSKRQKVDCSS